MLTRFYSKKLQFVDKCSFENCYALCDIDLSKIKVVKEGCFTGCYSFVNLSLTQVEEIEK
jgi:hypothetical protein